MNKQHTGFTLLETMIVVAIIAILAAMAAPSFSSLLEKQRITGAAEAVLADLRWARAESIKRNRNVRAIFTTGSSWSYTIISDSNSNGTFGDTVSGVADETIKSVNGSDFTATSLAAASFSGVAYATFDPARGTASAGGVKIDTTNLKLKVNVSILGRISICTRDGSVSGYPDDKPSDSDNC